MVDNLDGFKDYLQENTQLSDRAISNVICRLKRADKILSYDIEPFYLERLGKMKEFRSIPYTVQSQIRGAVRKYDRFLLDSGDYSHE